MANHVSLKDLDLVIGCAGKPEESSGLEMRPPPSFHNKNLVYML